MLNTSLKFQALGVETVLQSLIKTFGLSLLREKREFFSELLLNEKWEGVAFITLYDQNKTILLHSNPELIGKKIEKSLLLDEKSQSGFYQLKTGEVVFLYENFINSSKKPLIIRIALHIDPIKESLNFAKNQFYIELFLSLILFIGGILGFFILSKIEQALLKMEELKRWQFITRILLHEIKNPLASIKGFTQYLQKKELLKNAEKPLAIILKESIRIENLLKDLSNFSFPKEAEIKPFNLRELLIEITHSFRFLYEEIKIELSFEGKIFEIKSDPEKLKSILINLIDNALQASLEAGKEKVEVTLKEQEGYYIIQIKDWGSGIDQEVLPHIFEPFYTTKSKGTGLGFAIVKNFCEELGIKINLISEKGRGTTVWLKIPKSL
ncbi:MAG: ATP-binding protein [Caldimicrobium sp.]